MPVALGLLLVHGERKLGGVEAADAGGDRVRALVAQDAGKDRRGVEEDGVEGDRLPLPGAAELAADEMIGLDA